MSAQIICEKCMSIIPSDKQECPYCGHSFTNSNVENALPVKTLLKEKYTIGKLICEDSEGFLYNAVCLQTKKHVMVKEFAPQNLCEKRIDGIVLAKDGYEVLFKTIRMDFKELYENLKRLDTMKGLNKILDIFDQNGTSYSVCEKINFISLREYMKSKRRGLTSAEAAMLLKPICAGVDAMNRLGIIHRGISPDTILITLNGEAILSGYATLGVRTFGSELVHQLFDGYAAPEQYTVAEFDGNYTDIYALGAVFYFAMSRTDPHMAKKRRQDDTMPTLKQLLHNAIPSYVSSAVARAMRMPAVERAQSAAELLNSIERSQKNSPSLTSVQKIIIASICITAACILLLAFVVVLTVKENFINIPSQSQSNTAPVISEPEVLTVPKLVGEMYADVQNDPKYLGVFHFPITQEFSSDFKAGQIIKQDPIDGAQIENGGVIRLVVSSGPKTVLMPEIVGLLREEAKAKLNALGIKHLVFTLENDGSYIPDTVAKTDVPTGTVIVVETDEVMVYVAKEMRDIPPDSSTPIPQESELPKE